MNKNFTASYVDSKNGNLHLCFGKAHSPWNVYLKAQSRDGKGQESTIFNLPPQSASISTLISVIIREIEQAESRQWF